MNQITDEKPPFSVPQLARRWDCSEGLVRKLIRDGKLVCFRPGTLIRISAAEVERYECQGMNRKTIPSSVSSEDTQSSGGSKPNPTRSPSAAVTASRRKIAKAPKRKLASSGNGATIHHGPWNG